MNKLNKRITFAAIQAAVAGDKEKALYYQSRIYEQEGLDVRMQLYDLTPEQQKVFDEQNDFKKKMDISVRPFTLSI